MLIVGAFGLGMGLWARAIILDDAMITFRVAENLAYGRGFVYNPGEYVQVTTTPLYTMLLAGGSWLFGSAPKAALALNLTLSAAIPILAYDVGRRLAGRITGAGGAILLMAMPLLLNAFSMESFLYVAFILASLDAYSCGRYLLAGILAGFTGLIRGDAVSVGAVILSYDVLASRRFRWPLIIPAITIPALWYLFASVYYGSPFPATLAAKSAQGEMNWLGERFLSGFNEFYWEKWTLEDYGLQFYWIPVLLVIGLGPVLWRERLWLVLIGRDLLYIAIFAGLGVTFSEWYYAPLMPGVALLTARGIQLISTGLAGVLPSPRARPFVSASLALALVVMLLKIIYPATAEVIKDHPDWKAKAYPQVGRWLAQHTQPTASLGLIDIGHLGYQSRKQIIDIVGLAQPDVAQHISQGDFGYAIRHYEPDMILLGALWLPEVQRADWFQKVYVPRQMFRPAALSEPLVLFTRREGVNLPDSDIPFSALTPLEVDFNRQVTLAGYHYNQPTFPGSALNLTLAWQVEASLQIDFTVFVQLVEAGGTVIQAQGDGKPQHGFYPTHYWQPGERVIDTHILPLDPNLPAGAYDLLVGFYEAESGARLQILGEEGQFKSDYLRLSGVQIQQP
jgi:hypothetical protein